MSGRTTLTDLARLALLYEKAALAKFGAAKDDAHKLDARIATLAAAPGTRVAESDLASIHAEINWAQWRADTLAKLRTARQDMQPGLDALRADAATAVGRNAAMAQMIRQAAEARRQKLTRRIMAEGQDFRSDILPNDVNHQHIRGNRPKDSDSRLE